MAGTMLDEALTEGLKQAKKSPRNFALIVKGANPVKLFVRKKKFRDGELAKAKTEAKGNDYIVGVLVVSGADFAFQVLAEPTVKPLKLKELITEPTEMTAKPRWEVLPTLPDIGGDEEDEQAESEAAEVPPAPPPPPGSPPLAPPPPAIDANQLVAAMNKLSPQIQAAAAANPDRKKELVTPVTAFQQHIKNNQLDQAKAVLGQLVTLLKSLGPAPAPGSETRANPLVAFAKIRLDWEARKKAVQAKIAELHAKIVAESDDPEDAAAAKNLHKVLARFNEGLGDTIDEMRNATEQAVQRRLTAKAVEIANRYLQFLHSDPLVAHVEENPYEVTVAVRESLTPPLDSLKQGVAQLSK